MCQNFKNVHSIWDNNHKIAQVFVSECNSEHLEINIFQAGLYEQTQFQRSDNQTFLDGNPVVFQLLNVK